MIKDDLKNKKVNEIFEDDSKKFKLIARFYEMAFYLIVTVLIIYFLGLTFYVNNFNFYLLMQVFRENSWQSFARVLYSKNFFTYTFNNTCCIFIETFIYESTSS